MINDGIKIVGLLGTAFTMEEEFYKERLTQKYRLKAIAPNKKDRQTIHKIIYNELCLSTSSNS